MDCITDITIPTLLTEPCGNIYISTLCTISPEANVVLDLPVNSTQSETNAAITSALVYKEQQIQDILNTPILDISGKEDTANKQNSLSVDGTGVKFPTVDAVNTIGLQKVLDVGNTVSFDGGFSTIDLLSGAPNDRLAQIYVSDDGNSFSELYIRSNVASINGYSSVGRQGYFSINGGNAKIFQSTDNGSVSSTLSFDDNILSTGSFDFKIPAKPIVGTYTLATLDDIPAPDTNTTTIVLSSATLTSTYPTAITGFKVHALSIIEGGRIYEKTSTGWCEYLATITS